MKKPNKKSYTVIAAYSDQSSFESILLTTIKNHYERRLEKQVENIVNNTSFAHIKHLS